MSPPLLSSRVLKLGLIQMSSTDDPDANLDKALASTREAAARGAQVICLPELFRSRYFCQTEEHRFFELAEPIPGPSTEAFTALAADTGVTVIVSLFERRAAGLYHNTAVVIEGAAGCLGRYRKMHIPDDPRYFEKFYFTPGDLGFRAFPTARGVLGVLICWDQWYPEAARLTALQGAEVLFYPTAIGWHPEEKRRSTVRRSTRPGSCRNAPMPWPTAASSWPSIAPVLNPHRRGYITGPPRSGRASSSGDRASWPGPTAPSSIARTLPKRACAW